MYWYRISFRYRAPFKFRCDTSFVHIIGLSILHIMCVVHVTGRKPAVLLTTPQGVDAWHYRPLITGLMCDVLLTTHHRGGCTSYWPQSRGGCTTSYWPLIRGWIHNVLLTTHHRGRCTMSYWPPIKGVDVHLTDHNQGWISNLLLTTHQGVDA